MKTKRELAKELRVKYMILDTGLEILNKLEEAIKVDPTYASLYSDKGAVLNHLKRYEEALLCYNLLLDLDPDNAAIYVFNKGLVLSGKYEKEKGEQKGEQVLSIVQGIVTYYDKAIELNPTIPIFSIEKMFFIITVGMEIEIVKSYYSSQISSLKNSLKEEDVLNLKNENEKILTPIYFIKASAIGGAALGEGLGYLITNCTIFNIDEIVYEKEILNYPKLLEFLTSTFGNLNKVLSINDLVDPTLITEAKETDDMDLLLAGFNSAINYDCV